MIVRLLICDVCAAEGLPECGRNTMREYGWETAGRDGELDLCPRCALGSDDRSGNTK